MYHASLQIPPHIAMSIPHFIGIAIGWGTVLFVAFAIIFIWMLITIITQSNRINLQNATIYRLHQEKTKLYETFAGERRNVPRRLRRLIDDLAAGNDVSEERLREFNDDPARFSGRNADEGAAAHFNHLG
jgi:uncharacterized membrane protein YhiD involved in acid resistance